jgi:hypothetical protein
MSRTTTLLWIGCGSCSGESMALLGVDGQAADLLDVLDEHGFSYCGIPRFPLNRWHPSSTGSAKKHCR